MKIKTDLMQHQKTGVEKLLPLKVGALFMEMGTGKTRTALEIVKLRLDKGKLDQVLWLCPCSVENNLIADLNKHAQDWEAVIKIAGIESISQSYTLPAVLLEYAQYGKTMLIVDESSLIKNPNAIRSKRIGLIAENCKYRMILNGTPISRTEADLYWQWHILDWRILGYRSYYTFAANHLEYDKRIPGRIVRALNTDVLAAKIGPYTYQVKRDDCFSLPPKKYGINTYNLTQEQQQHYDYIADIMLLQLDELNPDTIYRLFAALQAVISGRWVNPGIKHMTTTPMYINPMDNPRISCLVDTIHDNRNEKHLIYAKYSHEIEDVVKVLNEHYGVGAAIPFYGKVIPKEREKAVQLFAGTGRFMVANKACAAFGLNLQFCNRIVFYDNDWDYATRIQAEDRVHRLGQEKEVIIKDIMANDTLDGRIVDCLNKKESLLNNFRAELQSGKNNIRKWIGRKE